MSEINAREMVNAPKNGSNAAKAKVNPFQAIFPVAGVVFRMNIQKEPNTWRDGTTSRTLADAILNIGGIPGAYVPSARVVQKTKAGHTTFDLQMPSSGQQFRHPMISCKEDENTDRLWDEHRAAIVKCFLEWRKAEVAKGAASISKRGGPEGIAATQEDLTALGIE
jgi:hypothetical protein